MTDIAEYFGIELPSATSLLNKLYDQKFVERLTDPNDRRLVIIKLTKIGKEILDLAMQERRKKIEELFSYLSEKEKLDLLNIFRTLDNRVVGKNI
jgi:DNA-binding MarR family transcriptional regulator